MPNLNLLARCLFAVEESIKDENIKTNMLNKLIEYSKDDSKLMLSDGFLEYFRENIKSFNNEVNFDKIIDQYNLSIKLPEPTREQKLTIQMMKELADAGEKTYGNKLVFVSNEIPTTYGDKMFTPQSFLNPKSEPFNPVTDKADDDMPDLIDDDDEEEEEEDLPDLVDATTGRIIPRIIPEEVTAENMNDYHDPSEEDVYCEMLEKLMKNDNATSEDYCRAVASRPHDMEFFPIHKQEGIVMRPEVERFICKLIERDDLDAILTITEDQWYNLSDFAYRVIKGNKRRLINFFFHYNLEVLLDLMADLMVEEDPIVQHILDSNTHHFARMIRWHQSEINTNEFEGFDEEIEEFYTTLMRFPIYHSWLLSTGLAKNDVIQDLAIQYAKEGNLKELYELLRTNLHNL
jgi:hypothetical protein